jgi:DNA-binding CsgD family transcriptional regulator
MHTLVSAPRELLDVGLRADAITAMPTCPVHPGSTVRRYRSHGPAGPGVYPQCVPPDGDQPHMLEWPALELAVEPFDDSHELSECELDVLTDAAAGLTTVETARKRTKGVETVKTQRRSILLKLGARNMTHAVGMTSEARHEVAELQG